MPVLGGLLEVELDRLPVRADPEPDPQPVPVRPRQPGVVGVEVVRIAEVEQLGQTEVGTERLLAVRRRPSGAAGPAAGPAPRRCARSRRVGTAEAALAVHRLAEMRAVGIDVED